ncbi:uncharacterized protein LOC112693199 [Sipha flava]|uniref:Uncharacterized protein LOC112693199 n=1 Tax=Sipha flava TaxID=143950 RepID=A0A8B8GLU9_9HEMI|nr:uncharacterized protein LOC112693199 [Sipha flava]
MSDKRIRLSGAAYKKAAKEKLEKTDNMLRKIPKLHLYFAATNPEKTESELKKYSPKNIDKIGNNLDGAYEVQTNQVDVQNDNEHAEEGTSANERQTEIIKSSFHNVGHASQIPLSDPAKWNYDSDSINFLLENPPKLDLQKLPFEKTKRIIGNTSRCLTPDNFMRKLQNGEKKIRD